MSTLSPPRPTAGFTLIELLVALTLTVLLIGSLAMILPRAMQLSRSDTLTAATNTTLNAVARSLNIDLDRSRPVIVLNASRTRLDVLSLGNANTLGAQPLPNATVIPVRFLGAEPGEDVVFINSFGDYLVTTIKAVDTTAHTTTVVCPMTLPGQTTAYRASHLSYASGESLTAPAGFAFNPPRGTPRSALYRASTGATSGLAAVSTWEHLTDATNVGFAPVYGQTVSNFGDTLAPAAERQGDQAMTGINYAITAINGGQPVTNAGTIQVRLAAKTRWTCGKTAKTPPPDLGKVQVNTMLEGNSEAPGTPDVTLYGPTTTTSITTFTVTALSDMTPGRYSATAKPLDANGTSYDPHITNSPTDVGYGNPQTINIDYQEALGNLEIIEDGLPSGRASQIDGVKPLYEANPTLRGKQASLKALTNALLPGTYTIDPETPMITVGTQQFTASSVTVIITARKTTTAHVQWQPAGGTVKIRVQGLNPSEKLPLEFYSAAPYYLQSFATGNADYTWTGVPAATYGLHATHTATGNVAHIVWSLGGSSGSTDAGDAGITVPVAANQTTNITITYGPPTPSTPSGGGGTDAYLVWGSVSNPLPNAVVRIRPGLDDHQSGTAPMTAYIMANLDAVKVAAGWYTIIVSDAASNTPYYRILTYLGSSPAYALTLSGPEYTVQGNPIPYLSTLYVGNNTKGNLVFYDVSELNRPLKTKITTPNDGVVHTTLDQALLQYVGSFGISDGANGVLWQLQQQLLHVDYTDYQVLQAAFGAAPQGAVTARNFCLDQNNQVPTFQSCLTRFVQTGRWW